MANVLNNIKYDRPKEPKKKEDLDEDVLKQMVLSPSSGSQEGNITTPDETAQREKDANEQAKMLINVNSKAVKERIGKYKEELFNKAKSDPSSFEIEINGEWMNLKEAIAKGYNPKTGQFDLDPLVSKKEELLSKLPPGERDKLSQMIDPANLELSESQGEEMGLSPDNPMLAANGNTAPMDPAMMDPAAGGMPPEGAMPPMDPSAMMGGM